MRSLPALVLCLLAAAMPAAKANDNPALGRPLDIPTRPGVTERVYLTLPAGAPRAALMLFEGRIGVLSESGSNNFLVRTRGLWVEHGFAVALIDVPSDQSGGVDLFRASADQAVDVAAVAARLRREVGAPVWLVGTSRGTISAAMGATGDAEIAGVVLTSSVTGYSAGRAADLFLVPLERIHVPVLVVHNRRDECMPLKGAEDVVAALSHAPAKELVVFESTERSSPRARCSGSSPHGFFGIDAQVVAAISDWILRH